MAKKSVPRLWRPGSLPALLAANSRRVRVAALCAMVTAVFATAGVSVWHKVRTHVESQPEYLVPASNIEITAQPSWIHTDLKAEVVRDAGLPPKLSILDEHLADRLSQAFTLHPWIASVDGVQTSYPARISVKLSYRKPVAMVAVYGGLLPVDIEGVLLPTADFTPEQAKEFPRIAGIATSPLGPVGTRWGDPNLESLVKLADYLTEHWQSLGLHQLQATNPQTAGSAHHQVLEIVTHGGTSFLWGSPPGAEAADETDAASKLAQLEQLLKIYGALDRAPTDHRDLREGSKIP